MTSPVGTVRYVIDNTNNINYVEDTYNNSVSIVVDYTQYYANIVSKLASIDASLKAIESLCVGDGVHLRMINGWPGAVANISSTMGNTTYVISNTGLA